MHDGMSANVVLWQRDKEQQAAFDDYQYEWHVKRSKHRGDYHALAAQAISGEGDYLEADMGEPPQGARW